MNSPVTLLPWGLKGTTVLYSECLMPQLRSLEHKRHSASHLFTLQTLSPSLIFLLLSKPHFGVKKKKKDEKTKKQDLREKEETTAQRLSQDRATRSY